MATSAEARHERAIAALEAASKLYEGKGQQVGSSTVLIEANAFLKWLERNG